MIQKSSKNKDNGNGNKINEKGRWFRQVHKDMNDETTRNLGRAMEKLQMNTGQKKNRGNL